MAPSLQTSLLSPAELSYIHSSLSATPPTRPDLRAETEFRPLVAETDILPSTNGSARVCFSDGTEAIAGIKAEVEKSSGRGLASSTGTGSGREAIDVDEPPDDEESYNIGVGEESWIEVTIEIPGFRDDDSLPVFLAAMLLEALTTSGDLKDKLYINAQWHWRLYIDILLLSPPLSYPLPLLSLTTHLALLATHLPRRVSDLQDDPLFDDDWTAAIPLYPQNGSPLEQPSRPPVTLLVMTSGPNIIFDPAMEEIAVADAVFAVSIGQRKDGTALELLALRTVDSPARLTPLGGHTSTNFTTSTAEMASQGGKVWRPPAGGMNRGLMISAVKMVLSKNGVGEEVLAGLQGVIA